jgi:hypothetical protein
MGWVRRAIPAKSVQPDPILVGLDLNSSAARAVHGPTHIEPRPLALAGSAEDLPMVLSLENRHAVAGQAGAALCRQAPHLACLDFLAFLGERREWTAGRHRLDAGKALRVVFDHLQTACADAEGIVLAVPGYLTRAQVALIMPLATKAKLKILGSLSSPLANAVAAYSVQPWVGTALVLDIDDHALVASTVTADTDQLWVHATQKWPALNLRAWKGRILDAIADRCVRQSRRDPRDCASAEQSLYEQLEHALGRAREGKFVEVLIQTTHWYQNLILRPEEFAAFCERLVGQTVDQVRTLLASASTREAIQCICVTHAVGRLPGLAGALEKAIQMQPPTADAMPSTDFGDDLLEPLSEPAGVVVLPHDAAARTAHSVAVLFHRKELARGHLELTIPLPKSDAAPTDPDPAKRNLRILSADP